MTILGPESGMPTRASKVDSSSEPPRSDLCVVIVNYKTAQLTICCLETLEPELAAIPGSRAVIVENDSGDGEVLARAIADRGWGGWAKLDISDVNGGFAYGNNRVIRLDMRAENPPRYFMLLNPDTQVRPGAIRALIAFMDSHPEVGIAGSGLENPDGSDWPFAFRFITPLSELERGLQLGLASRLLGRYVVARVMPQERPQEVDWVAGAAMIIRLEVIVDIGPMDEGYFLYFEEVDFCLMARRNGWRCWYVPQSRVMHIAGQSSNLTLRDRRPPRTPAYWFASRRRYFLKNFGLLGAVAADLAFGLGFGLWRIRRALQRKPDHDPPHHLADFWKHSVLRRRNRSLDFPY